MEALSRNSVIVLSIVLEAALLLVAAVWMYFAHIELRGHFQFQALPLLWGIALSIASSALAIALVVLGKRISFLSGLTKMSEEFLQPLVGLLGPADILLLSLLSGFCEEVLFRGILQAQIGVFAASFVFGIFHDPSFKQKSYIILATLAGLALGLLYQWTGNLWSCILAHAAHNFVAMISLRYFFKRPA